MGTGIEVLFLTLIAISSVQVLVNSILVVGLGYINPVFALLYLLGDKALFLGQKTAAGEFRHWLNIDGFFGLFLSFLIRVIVKFIVDFTGCVHFRHPYDVGGLYYTANLFVQIAGLVSVLILIEGSFSPTTSNYMNKFGLCLGVSLICLLGLFFSTINREYTRTFFSTETGGQTLRNIFLNGDDFAKSQVFEKHRLYWKSIEDKVEAWVKAGRERWEEEKRTGSWIDGS